MKTLAALVARGGHKEHIGIGARLHGAGQDGMGGARGGQLTPADIEKIRFYPFVNTA